MGQQVLSHQSVSSQWLANQSATSTLPLLDLSLLSGSDTERQAFLTALRHAARDVGFFYLTGHGIDTSLLRQIQILSRQFFALSDEEKLSIAMIRSPHFRGYNRAASDSPVVSQIGASNSTLVLKEPHYHKSQAHPVGHGCKARTNGQPHCQN